MESFKSSYDDPEEHQIYNFYLCKSMVAEMGHRV